MDYVAELRRAVIDAEDRWRDAGDDRAEARTAPGKWSAKEIIGHLIDSASNNHQRFVRAQFQDDLVFPGYDQNEWVRAQHYHHARWPELLALWRDFNLHLARVMETTTADVRLKQRRRHNLHEIAFRPASADAPATLDFLMEDYVVHLRHHLRQIAAILDR
jgi:hypothetical protein